MNLTIRINSFHKLGEEIKAFLANPTSEEWNTVLKTAEHQNGWFTRDSVVQALQGIIPWLDKAMLEKWVALYPDLQKERKPLSVNVIMAGNIPLVGFHDFLCVLITGNIINVKLSSSDSVLLQFLANKLIAIEPEWKQYINFVDRVPTTANVVIATGSNNTARNFEYYFKNFARIIRKNRNGIAILDGKETTEELGLLGEDIFSYFGLGCRNVSKLFVPKGYDFGQFFRGIEKFKDIINHHKYANNYNYNRTVFLMDAIVFTDNGFLMVIQKSLIASPIATVYFEEYSDLNELSKLLASEKENIQCVTARNELRKQLQLPVPVVALGQAQSPQLWDYADGVDVVKFLLERNMFLTE